MPIRARNFGKLVLGSLTEIPATVMEPSWNGSSPFTHLMSVDLPEPEGPQTTTTSPLATRRLQLSSTWKPPYHLLALRMSSMKRAPEQDGMASAHREQFEQHVGHHGGRL